MPILSVFICQLDGIARLIHAGSDWGSRYSEGMRQRRGAWVIFQRRQLGFEIAVVVSEASIDDKIEKK